jgi:hypothetical protein
MREASFYGKESRGKDRRIRQAEKNDGSQGQDD